MAGGDPLTETCAPFRMERFTVDPVAGEVLTEDGAVHAVEPKVFKVLLLLCENAGSVVTRGTLIERVWGVEFGGDESLTRAISQLRKILRDNRGVQRLIETIPKNGYRLRAEIERNIKLNSVVSIENGAAADYSALVHSSFRWLHILNTSFLARGGRSKLLSTPVILFVVLASAAVVITGSFIFAARPTPAAERSVAVLSFNALSTGAEDEFFADGLTEEVTNALWTLHELNVVAASSSTFYKGKGASNQEIAKALGVTHLVDGTIRRAEGRIRITAKLSRANDGRQLWVQTYDRPIQNILEIQSDIAEKIAEALDVILDDSKRLQMTSAGLRDVEAFVAFQKASVLQDKAHGELPQIPTLIEANSYYDRVTELVPGYWPAYFVKTDLHTHILLDAASGDKTPYSSVENVNDARDALNKILKVSYERARNDRERAYVSIVGVLFSDNWNNAGRYHDQAFELSKCDNDEQWTQILSIPFGRAKKARDFFQKNVTCDPLSSVQWNNAAMASLYLHEPEQALSIIQSAKAKRGFTPLLERTRFEALLAARKFDEAEAVLQNLSERVRLIEQIGLYAARGEKQTAMHLTKKLYAQSSQSSNKLAAPLGDVNDALTVSIAPLIGDREGANAAATRIDARQYGPTKLAQLVQNCLCGAPFDLDATPNFKARLEEAKFHWPPPSPIDYPLKDW